MIKRIYEAKDASLNVSAEVDFFRFLVGIAHIEAPFNKDVHMRVISLHVGPICVTFTRFSLTVPKVGPRRPASDLRSPTRQSGVAKPKRS